MRYILLMSHGHLASGMLSTVELIAGKHENLIAYDAYVDGHQDVRAFAEAFFAAHSEDEIIAVTDVLGGSVNNEMLRYNHLPRFHLIAGMNAPLVLNLILQEDGDAAEIIQECVDECKPLIQYFRKMEDCEEDEF